MRWPWLRIALTALLAAFVLTPVAHAHEIRPAYLQIDEIGPDRYEVSWRTPLLSGMRLPVALRFPSDIRNITGPSERELPDSLIERRVIDAPGGLAGRRIEFVALEATITDVLVRTQARGGGHTTTLVHPSQPWVVIEAKQTLLSVARTYLVHGVNHILFGVDHLLFVLGLVLMVRDRWMLIKTITAFTVAHSITLALATLGYVQVPAPPLNAAIALSILFVGVEVSRSWRGETSLALRQPWLVAFLFGLLHGIGFASGLVNLGLPQSDIPLALLTFNIGVEIGQLLFVAGILLLERAFRLMEITWPRPLQFAPAYVLGISAAFWTIDRIVAMLEGAT
ncbi:HupE / UreJ protein [Rhizobiales bacterium GAS113]|nr:HupE / UreJ protein [Rhizobiales bacterium GAS113]